MSRLISPARVDGFRSNLLSVQIVLQPAVAVRRLGLVQIRIGCAETLGGLPLVRYAVVQRLDASRRASRRQRRLGELARKQAAAAKRLVLVDDSSVLRISSRRPSAIAIQHLRVAN